MKRILMALIVSTVLMATSTYAADGMYGAASLPLVQISDAEGGGVEIRISPWIGLIGALGYDLGVVRVEGEISYRSYDVDKVIIGGVRYSRDADVSNWSVMANGYYDLETRTSVTPYAGLGLGLTRAKRDISGFDSESSTELAYQLMLGAAFEVSSQAALTAGYRFFGYTDNDGEYVHELNVGARFMF